MQLKTLSAFFLACAAMATATPLLKRQTFSICDLSPGSTACSGSNAGSDSVPGIFDGVCTRFPEACSFIARRAISERQTFGICAIVPGGTACGGGNAGSNTPGVFEGLCTRFPEACSSIARRMISERQTFSICDLSPGSTACSGRNAGSSVPRPPLNGLPVLPGALARRLL